MARIVNNLPSFGRSVKKVMDDALRSGAADVLRNAKTRAPFMTGQLRGDSDAKKAGALKWRISFFKEYARFQEFGGDGKRTVRNYSTSGTGKFYLKRSGDEQASKLAAQFSAHGKRARA